MMPVWEMCEPFYIVSCGISDKDEAMPMTLRCSWVIVGERERGSFSQLVFTETATNGNWGRRPVATSLNSIAANYSEISAARPSHLNSGRHCSNSAQETKNYNTSSKMRLSQPWCMVKPPPRVKYERCVPPPKTLLISLQVYIQLVAVWLKTGTRSQVDINFNQIRKRKESSHKKVTFIAHRRYLASGRKF